MSILNLTQHESTPAQREAGVYDFSAPGRQVLNGWLTVGDLPTVEDLAERAARIADMVPEGIDAAMIGGAGPLMRALRRELKARGVTPLEAFSRREVTEVTGPDGKVTKVATFVHAGWWPDVD